jgi:signal transduction histidine kinase/ActR/RegA family two-component response regulator
MIRFSSLRARLVGTVFLAVLAGWLVAFVANLEIASFAAGILALVAAWFGGERFIIRQVRSLLQATTRLAGGDLTARTGITGQENGELGDLARTIDSMAGTLEQRVRERENAERALRIRAQQQTAVAALGQFALTTSDLDALMNQAVTMVAQTLEVEFSEILEFFPATQELHLSAGVGWKEGMVGQAKVDAGPDTLARYALKTLEAIRVTDYRDERRFAVPTLARYHGAISGVTVAVTGRDRDRPFGVLGAHSAKTRTFTDDDEQFLRAVANLLAMTVDRKRAEAEIQKRAVFAQRNPTPAIEVNDAGAVTYANDAALKLALDMGHSHPAELLAEIPLQQIENARNSNLPRLDFDTHPAGRTLSWSVHPIPEENCVHSYITDTTERLKLEANLRQADKMMAIGQLAAGVAHDFNNMLTVIQGRAGILLQKSDLTGTTRESAQAIYFAAERAAGLTRQLLMFSRKNVKQAGQLDLAAVVQGMSDMLKRLLGETITLEFAAPTALPRISGDRNEIEQVIMNLVVNARDAMFNGGTVHITTDTVKLTAEMAAHHPDARPGSFVRLRVTDTGCGMDQPTMERIFEPFFTTKEIGKGTGLGLATVYGIVKQHEGWLEVESELDRGTTFSVLLPAAHDADQTEAVPSGPTATDSATGGTETILIVEDEIELREMAVQILESFGYRHFEAGSGPEALEVWKQHSAGIDMMLTDMIMPGGLSGRDLAKELISQRPGLPVVIASGYSVEDISDELSANHNISFVQKPYNLDVLAKAIRAALDQAKAGTPKPSTP